MFKALVLEQAGGAVLSALRALEDSRLPEGEVTVAVEYSTVNYKDGLIVSGGGGMVKSYPHVPGIDFAGTVLDSADARYRAGDKVVLTGWRGGETHWGGLAQKARVRADWLVPLPEGFGTREAMAIGTAGFTAMLAVMALEEHGIGPGRGEVLVTAAAGGVGSIATAILSLLGYAVVCSSGRPETQDYLRGLGAASVIDRSAFAEPARRPLESERWAACIDSVGGNTLARVLAQMRYAGSVADVGLAGGSRLEISVIPFLLRGLNLLVIDSVTCPFERRQVAWRRLRASLSPDRLRAMSEEVKLEDVPRIAAEILKGQIRGRVVVAMAT